jgi:hypothetical protein
MAISAALEGGTIAFHLLGYGIAAVGVGPSSTAARRCQRSSGVTGAIAAAMGLRSFIVRRRRTRAAGPIR